jgi:undecaprenyl diphosphate synthase
VRAVKRIGEAVRRGEIEPGDVEERTIAGYLDTAGIPDPDLLIRTGGEMRVSNFLIWQIAYTEIWVTDVLWPDFTREHFYRALEDYGNRERRFGVA